MSTSPRRPRVVAIVQARMASTRLPGKVMHPIAGKPLLWHVIHRLRRCQTLDHIAIATSTERQDDAIAAFGREHGVLVSRGSEHNVLARYLLAAWQTDAEVIVRVSADAPFVDAGFIDHLVETLLEKGGDYVVLEPGAKCAHEGVDPFTRRALEKLAHEAARDRIAREQVSGYFKLNPNFVDIVHAPGVPQLAKEPPRLTVDTPDDVAFAEAVHARLSAQAGEASLEDLLWLIEREPSLRTINAHVRQKPVTRQGMRALLCCDGGGDRGFGRVRRSIMLARNLRDREGLGVVVALQGDKTAADMVRKAGFEAVTLSKRDPGGALVDLAGDIGAAMLAADCREGIGRTDLTAIAAHAPIVAVIDDPSDRRLAATHAYYPPLESTKALRWDADTAVRIGWQWSLLGFDPALQVHDTTLGEKTNGARLRVVVSMGSADSADGTQLAARALAKLTVPFHARFIIGPGFIHGEETAREIESFAPNFTAVRGADVAAEFAAADLALTAFGVTAYELAALGIPTLYVGVPQPHLEAARAFEEAGFGQVIGLGRTIDETTIARSVLDLVREPGRRQAMREISRAAIDGKGAERVAADLASALETRLASRLQHAS